MKKENPENLSVESLPEVSIRKVSIENFKAFGGTQSISIKPITLLFGANSAGKSTIIKALVYIREFLKWNRHPNKADMSGEIIDFGTFRDVVHNHDIDKTIRFTLEFDFSQKIVNNAQVLESVYGEKVKCGKVLLELDRENNFKISIWLNGEHVWTWDYVAGGDHSTVQLDTASSLVKTLFLNWDKRGTEDWFTQGELEQIDLTFESRLHPSYCDWQTALSHRPAKTDSLSQEFEKKACCHNNPRLFLIGAIPIRALAAELSEKMLSIGPLRKVPERGFMDEMSRSSDDRQYSWYNGLAAWMSLKWAFVPDPDLRIPEDVALKRLADLVYTIKRLNLGVQPALRVVGTIEQSASQWRGEDFLEALHCGKSNKEQVEEMLEKDVAGNWEYNVVRTLSLIDIKSKKEMAPCDLGTGVSQVLPIAIGAHVGRHNIMTVEQPELHLHPRLQCDLGDLFISCMHKNLNFLSSRMFIVETHSEHLILRLLRRIRETSKGTLKDDTLSLTPDDVSILYAEKTIDGVRITERRVGKDAEFLDEWPGGFFEESFDEFIGGL